MDTLSRSYRFHTTSRDVTPLYAYAFQGKRHDTVGEKLDTFRPLGRWPLPPHKARRRFVVLGRLR